MSSNLVSTINIIKEYVSMLSRECLFVSCRPEPSFADMVCHVGNMLPTFLCRCNMPFLHCQADM